MGRRGRAAGLVAIVAAALVAGTAVWLAKTGEDTVTVPSAASGGTATSAASGETPVAGASKETAGASKETSIGVSKGTSMASGSGVVSDISAADLAKVARTRVFFGHQSVGMNVLGGIPAVYAEHGVRAPSVEARRDASGLGSGFIVHTGIGQNQNPLLKIEDFDSTIRGGLGSQIDVAMMKLCYIDVSSGTDIDTLFSTYQRTMTALERDFPRVTFVKVTVPLTTDPSTADNAMRERLNELIRKEYRGDHLFDLATAESTTPDGSQVVGTYEGKQSFALYGGYASDNGHLNAEGSRRAATAFLRAVAEASSR
jgi:hypothetical protein